MSLQPNVLDPTRIDILRALQTDSERPRKQIAHDIGISEPSLSKYISDLRVRGYIRKTAAVLDPKKLGFGNTSFFKVEFKDFATMERAEVALAARPEIQEIYGTDKGFELFIKMRTNSVDELVNFKFELAGMEGAGHVYMIPTLHNIKCETDLPI